LKNLKVLLIEDSPDNRMLITLYLGKEGAKVTPATNGAQGVELAMSEKFDVLLMDIQMPVLDGHQATRKLRSLGYRKPIVALTAHAMAEEHEKSKQSGFSEFLTKPIQRQELIEVLARYVP
jgi:CheY-like chemotaxis protein